jgi:hypothetical protein
MNATPGLFGSLALVLLACGGSTTSGGASSGAPGSCSISAGTYTQHLTPEAGGTNCPAIADQTVTLNGNETISGSGSSGAADGGNGCTTQVDSATCTFSTDCNELLMGGLNGDSLQISTTLTFNGDSATGKETVRSTDSTGKVVSSCTYDISMTKH